MPQFRKGQRLIKLCDQKTRTEQQSLLRHTRRQRDLMEEIKRCEDEIKTLEQLMLQQQLQGVKTTKAAIFELRRQQTMLLHKRQQVRLERTMRTEDLHDTEQNIAQCHRQIAVLKRKEMKFTKWTQSSKQEWLNDKATARELEIQESTTWRNPSN